jgi:hypothetical protein
LFKYYVYYKFAEAGFFGGRGYGNAIVTLDQPFGTNLDGKSNTKDIDEANKQIKEQNSHQKSDKIIIENIILLPIT